MTIQVYSKHSEGSKKLSANFRVREFACSDGSDPVFIDSELVATLQKIRNHFKAPVTITSAYRTPNHNKSVGGTTFSQHCFGRAADIKVKGVAPKTVAKYVDGILKNRGGIGVYSTFTHVDVRSDRARWEG